MRWHSGRRHRDDYRAELIELCRRGVLTCTSGAPGDEGATYALGWLPLDEPARYSAEVRERHARNMRALGASS